ncbi:tetratricopeptide repeat protein [Gluconobacter sp. P1D12_c]|uniref:tetratricopeptide repeat protein n=1 Tax=Gluconobacter sp. P1D12_c TaxID=2762614 RepID=UPI00207B1F10|nr:tetratricopeptide repeat protein [Gluconobacter sp. P1D12_c]
MSCPPQVQAQLLLGQMHVDRGWLNEAFPYFEAAARSGHPVAVNMLGRAYERGWGVSRNPAQAAAYFEVAAALGEAWAMFNLADLLLLGDGVPKNRARAYRLYVSSAEKGNVKALNMLGLLHEDGVSGSPDPEGAKVFFQAASEGGDCWADLNLARLALAQQDVSVAVYCLQKALKTSFPDVARAIIDLIGFCEDPAFHAVKAQAIRHLARKEPPRIVFTTLAQLSSGERLCAE